MLLPLFLSSFLVSDRGLPLVDDGGWNTVPISKGSRPIDTSRLTKITKVRLCSGVCKLEGDENEVYISLHRVVIAELRLVR